MTTKISQWKLEQLALGELPAAEAEELRAQLRANGDDRLDTLERSSAEILATYPPERMAAKIRARLDAGERRSRSVAWIGLSLGVATAAMLAWWIVRVPSSEVRAVDGSSVARVDPPPVEVTRAKGDPALLVYRKAPSGKEMLAPQAAAKAGDVLQVAYRAAGARHGVIVSWDGRQSVTLHFPSTPDATTELRQGGVVALEHGYELDDAPAFERFVFVTSSRSLDVDAVQAAARAVARGPRPMEAPLELAPGTKQKSFLVRKVSD